jgi:hypothetical protein
MDTFVHIKGNLGTMSLKKCVSIVFVCSSPFSESVFRLQHGHFPLAFKLRFGTNCQIRKNRQTFQSYKYYVSSAKSPTTLLKPVGNIPSLFNIMDYQTGTTHIFLFDLIKE